VPVDMF